ncbi:hypothetical protein GCM10009609_00590 [Pseudonocardia aurantiaca]|uniref:Response regulator transcription factor n=1 Tax=Pseudonocardia aurantiaca TaxID=75290 RepID=A0ABW4FE94_9PSEU
MIRILVVDDVEAIRLALAALLASVPELAVVGTCSGALQAAAAVLELLPDVVLMDVRMPHVDGIAATAALLALAPELRVLILSSSVDGPVVREAKRVGAVGYLLKSGEPEELVSAVFLAVAGGQWWCEPATEAVRHAT